MSSVFPISRASLAHRAQIAQLISSRQRVHPRTPFWNLRAHRIPTLWSLYRSLLRNSPTYDVRWRIRKIFERYRHLTSPKAVHEQLVKYHKWAGKFAKAQAGDEHLQAVLTRYSRMIIAKCEKEEFKQMLRDEFEWQAKLRYRPILTGAYLKPSLSNPPLPRLYPQPQRISSMIYKRRKAIDRQWVTLDGVYASLDDLEQERRFEERLLRTPREKRKHGVFSVKSFDWVWPLLEHKKELRARIAAGIKRREMPYPPELLEQIKQARREKVVNKTRELQREARGEILPRTIFRRRAGPPAHVLAKMTPMQKHLDQVSRSNVSEVGYVGWAKRKLGWKLRNPDAWKLEGGPEESKERLDKLTEEVMRENDRRMREADPDRSV